MNVKLIAAAAIAVASTLIACNSTDTELPWGPNSGNDVTDNKDNDTSGAETPVEVSSEILNDLKALNPSWDDFDAADFANQTETVPTNADAEEYEDYSQNSSWDGGKVSIVFADGAATVTGSVADVTVTSSGAHVTINSTATGVEYTISGSTSDGSLKIYSEKKFMLTLNGVSITSTKGAAINNQGHKRAFINLADGTQNYLADASSYTNDVADEDQKACLFSEGQLIFVGKGSLSVTGNYKHAICSDDYVWVHAGPTVSVTSSVKDAIHANEKFVMTGGIVELKPSTDGIDVEEGSIDIRGGLLKVSTSGATAKAVKAETDIDISGGSMVLLTSGAAQYDSDDRDVASCAGLKCDGSITISGGDIRIKSTGSGGKGIKTKGSFTYTNANMAIYTTGSKYTYGSLSASPKGIRAVGTVTINSGKILVRTSGSGAEGIESKSNLYINGGETGLYTYDDCINAASSSSALQITGGYVYAYATNNDGIDSNGSLVISGGVIVAIGTTAPEEAIDCDSSNYAFNGGYLVGIGGNVMSTASKSSQPTYYGSVGSVSTGTMYTICNSSGSHLMSFVSPRAFSTGYLVFSSPELKTSTSYTIYKSGEVSGGTSYGQATFNGTFSGGTSYTTFTQSSTVTSSGVSGMGGGMGGGGMGGGWR